MNRVCNFVAGEAEKSQSLPDFTTSDVSFLRGGVIGQHASLISLSSGSSPATATNFQPDGQGLGRMWPKSSRVKSVVAVRRKAGWVARGHGWKLNFTGDKVVGKLLEPVCADRDLRFRARFGACTPSRRPRGLSHKTASLSAPAGLSRFTARLTHTASETNFTPHQFFLEKSSSRLGSNTSAEWRFMSGGQSANCTMLRSVRVERSVALNGWLSSPLTNSLYENQSS